VLNLNAWDDILATYGRSMSVAVAMTDVHGRMLGRCHNPQPVWTMIRNASPVPGPSCPFCIEREPRCTAVADAFQSGTSAMTSDDAGLTHVAVPLSLGGQHLGAIVAGQIFARYPEPLTMRRVARDYGVSPQDLWAVARQQPPISAAALRASGDLLCGLGDAFLRQRYGAILETKLAETNGRFRLLVEAVKDYALVGVDAEGRVIAWNVGAERMLGYVESEVITRDFATFFTPDDIRRGRPAEHLRKALQQGRSEDEGWRVRKDRTEFLAHATITPLAGESDGHGGFALIMEDVTERRKVAIVLGEAQEDRIRLREAFLSHVSHELRTPLTAIYFFTTNLLDGILGDLSEPQREHLSAAVDNVKQLRDMVDDLLDIARIETEKLTVNPHTVNADVLIRDVFSTCRMNAALKKVTLQCTIAPDLPFAWGDPARVRQILTNLIDNAIKFTPEQRAVSVDCRLWVEDEAFLCVSVADTGIGITPANLAVVFDRLAQVNAGTESSRSGLGLGLFISKELVVRQGGTIWVSSEPGLGSTFSFTLPVFSLARLCARVFAAPNLAAGYVTVIAVDVSITDRGGRADLISDLRRLLERCIHPDRDVLLPPLNEAGIGGPLFIVAATDAIGFTVMSTRIRRELENLDTVSTLKPSISSTTLPVPPGNARDVQIAEVVESIQEFVQLHVRAAEGQS
jgi:PAS domain S-box-containing protein